MDMTREHLVDGAYAFRDLVDIDRLQLMFERFSEATGFTTGLVSYPDQKLLICTGWREICVNFHRAFPISEVYCARSNAALTSQLKERRELNIRRCESGLVDGATPVIIRGAHVANLATGQVFFEAPDIARFRKQGIAYGYDPDAYLKAVAKVPVVSEEKLKNALRFLSEMAVMLAEQGLTELRSREATREARASAEKLQITLNSIGDAVIATDISGAVALMNPVAEALTGRPADVARGKPLADTFHIVNAKTREKAENPAEKALATGKIVDLANHTVLIAENGAEHHIADSASPIKNAAGETTGVVLVFRDITEEYKLRERYRDKAFLVDSAASAIVMSDLDGNLSYVNPAFLKMWGYSRAEDVLGRPIADFWELDGPQDDILRASRGATAMAKEFRAKRRDGSVFEGQMSAAIVRDADDKPVAAMATALDTSDRRRAEDELRQLRNYLANIIDAMPSALIGVNAKGEITLWNKAAESLFGVSSENAKGKKIAEFHARASVAMDDIAESLRTGEIKRETQKPCQADAGVRYADTTIYPLVSAEIASAVVRVDDVTERVLLEQRLNQSQKLESIGQLAGGIAHDFNNLLGGVMICSELLSRKLKDQPALREYADDIVKTVKRGADLAGKLLTFSRKRKIAADTLDIQALVRDVGAILERSVDKRIALRYELNAQNPIVSGDPSLLQNVILNLGVNARDAMPEGGRLTLRCDNVRLDETYRATTAGDIKPGNYIQLSVIDTGVGMDQETLRRVFEPFFSTKEVGKGTGLGLSIAYGTIKDHGGAISAYSEPGKGAEFHVFLPVSEEAAPKTPLKPEEPVSGSGLVLLVDDEEQLRRIGRIFLHELGYETLLAADGRECVGVFAANAEKIDLVLLDMLMPGMNGRDCFREIRKIKPSAKVIVCSGFSSSPDIEALFQEGLNGFIKKPFAMAELSQCVANVMRGNA